MTKLSKYYFLIQPTLVTLYFGLFIYFINPFQVYHVISESSLPIALAACCLIFFLTLGGGFIGEKLKTPIISSALIPLFYFIGLLFIFFGESYFDLLLMALSAAIVPVFISIIYSRRPSTLLTLEEVIPDEMKVNLVKISGTNQNEEFELEANRLIAFEANDNYVNISFLDDQNQHQKKVFRSTLKSIAQQLANQSNFLKIHRSVIINTELIDDLLGNSQSRKVRMKYGGLTFPVSRNIRIEKPN